jgi:hypothetical protein
MKSLLITHTVIIIFFLFFAIRYFIKNSLRNKEQRLHGLRSVCRLIYYTPLFLQGLFLVYLAVVYFFFITKDFYFLLDSFFNNDRSKSRFDFLHIPYLFILCIAVLLLAVNAWLAKISMDKKISLIQLIYKVVYLFYSVLMIVLVIVNSPLVFAFGTANTDTFFYTDAYVLLLGALAYLALLILPLFYTTGNKLFRYLHLSAKVGFAYAFTSFLLALLFFTIYALLKLFFALAITGMVIENCIKAIPYVAILSMHIYYCFKTCKSQTLIYKAVNIIVSLIICGITLYKIYESNNNFVQAVLLIYFNALIFIVIIALEQLIKKLNLLFKR